MTIDSGSIENVEDAAIVAETRNLMDDVLSNLDRSGLTHEVLPHSRVRASAVEVSLHGNTDDLVDPLLLREIIEALSRSSEEGAHVVTLRLVNLGMPDIDLTDLTALTDDGIPFATMTDFNFEIMALPSDSRDPGLPQAEYEISPRREARLREYIGQLVSKPQQEELRRFAQTNPLVYATACVDQLMRHRVSNVEIWDDALSALTRAFSTDGHIRRYGQNTIRRVESHRDRLCDRF